MTALRSKADRVPRTKAGTHRRRGRLHSWPHVLTFAAIGLLVAVLYANVLDAPFQLDGRDFIARNASIRDLRDVKAIWRYWPTRSLAFLSYALNYRLHGLLTPGYRVLNLLIHFGTACGVVWLIRLTLASPAVRERLIATQGGVIALLGGLIFVAHPVQTQAVTYIYQRPAAMACLFYVLSLCLYAKARLVAEPGEKPASASGWYAGSLVAAVLGMFTKEIAFTLPVMVVIYDFAFFPGKASARWRRALPWLLCLSIIPLILLATRGVDLSSPESRPAHVPQEAIGISRAEYLVTQLRVLPAYLRLVLLPYGQNVDHGCPVSRSLWEADAVAGLAFLAAALAGCVRVFRTRRVPAFCMLWFFVALSVESSVIPFRDVMVEHRLYLPMVGLSFLLPAAVLGAVPERHRKAAAAALAGAVLCLAVMTVSRNRAWLSERSLWADAARKAPHKARARQNLATAYVGIGAYRLAVRESAAALAIYPAYGLAYNTRAYARRRFGEIDGAIADFTRALALRPGLVSAHYNRGEAHVARGEPDKAIADYDRALELSPEWARAYYGRGRARGRIGQYDLAIADFTRALTLRPRYFMAFLSRGDAHELKGDHGKAIMDYSRAILICPSFAEAYRRRAAAHLARGETREARRDDQECRRLRGSDPALAARPGAPSANGHAETPR